MSSAAQRQRYLGQRGLIVFIACLSMFGALSNDMYIPSLPTLVGYFGTTETVTNLTLIVFTISMAVGIFVFGPISDRLGRKGPLIVSIALYTFASFGCAASTNVWILVVMRLVEAFGAGGMSSLSLSLIKDCFEGRRRDHVLAVVSAMFVIAPMVAPVIGALILRVAIWRMVFIVLAVLGILVLITGMFMKETIPVDERDTGALSVGFSRMGVIWRNRAFRDYLIVSSLLFAPFMAYIGIASYIYQDHFALSATWFSIYFAINAGFSILGPILFLVMTRHMTARRIMNVLIAIALVCGVSLLLVGELSPITFFCSFLPFSLLTSVLRPYSTTVLFDQHEGDTGAQSSLINFCNSLMGGLGMIMGSMPWSDYVIGLGVCVLTFSLLTLVGWVSLLRSRKVTIQGIDRKRD